MNQDQQNGNGTQSGDASQSMDNNNGQASVSNQLEVLESKEGPNSEVVYKYQGGLFYIDREQKKMVKVEETDLKDSKSQVIVKDNMNQGSDNAQSSNRRSESSKSNSNKSKKTNDQ
jgi:hypothetical protein